MKNKWLLLILLSIIWGSSFILIKKSLESFHPIIVGALRVGISGLIFIPFLRKSIKLIPKKSILWTITAGFFGNFAPMFMFPIAEMKITSSLAGILNSFTPLFVVILGYLIYNIKLKIIQIIGVILGLFGTIIIIIFSGKEVGEINVWYALTILLATAMYAISALIINRHLSQFSSFYLSSIVFSFWGSISILIVIFWNFTYGNIFTINNISGFTYVVTLSIFGTSIAMLLYYNLIKVTSAIFASSVTYLMPVVAFTWGFIFKESFYYSQIYGIILIFLGIYFAKNKN